MEVMLSFMRFHWMQCGERIHLTGHVSERVPDVELCLSHAEFGQAFSPGLRIVASRHCTLCHVRLPIQQVCSRGS